MPLSKPFGLARCTIFASLVPVLLLVSCSRKHPDQASLSPQESLNRIHVSGDFHVELFASEPLVFDPVEMVRLLHEGRGRATENWEARQLAMHPSAKS